MNKGLLAVFILSANLFLFAGCADDQARAQIADLNLKIAQLIYLFLEERQHY